MNIGRLELCEKRSIHHGGTTTYGFLAKIPLIIKLEGKMGGAMATAFVFLLLLLMFGALGFIFGNFD